MTRTRTAMSSNPHLHHFIIMFDEETNEWKWDRDTEDALFGEGTLYSCELDEWLYIDQVPKEVQERNELLVEKMNKQLSKWNNE